MNEKYKLPKGRSINQMTLFNYNKKKIINESPIKQGPKPALPSTLLDLLQCHVCMCQLPGTGKCWPKLMKAIIGAAKKIHLSMTTNLWNTFTKADEPLSRQHTTIKSHESRGLAHELDNICKFKSLV